MKSLILLEVEHGEDTDAMAVAMAHGINAVRANGVKVTDYGVRIDLPACFVLDTDVPGTVELYVRAAATLPNKKE